VFSVMLGGGNGKLLVYASSFFSRGKHVEPVRVAAERVARQLRLGFEARTFDEKFGSVYVYYTNGDDEPVPIYRLSRGRSDVDGVCAALRNMMFVLSFHPRNSALREIREELMRFS
jgi:hypothetical protein